MQIIVRTKPYKQNSYCSHIVEHCVFSGYQSVENFFDIDLENNGESRLNYTKFYIPNSKSIEKFIDHINKDIDLKVLKKEKKILKEEIIEDENNTGNVLINKIGKKIYGKRFRWYPKTSLLKDKEIFDYHKKYYKKNNIRILDDDFKIKNRPAIKYRKHKINENNKINEFDIKIEGKTFLVYLSDYKSIYDYCFFYFLDWFYYSISNYNYRYKGSNYYSHICHFFEFTDKLCFVKRKDIKLNFDEYFFELAKNKFLENQITLNEILAIHEINMLEIVNLNDIKKILKGITYKRIKKYI